MIKSQKGISPIMSGIIIILISVMFIGLLINFSSSYFDLLHDRNDYQTNKNILTTLNQTIKDLENYQKDSYKKIELDSSQKIYFDSNKDVIEITQIIKNSNFYKDSKNYVSYGNLDINKSLNNVVFTLDVSDSIDINRDYTIMPGYKNIAIYVKENKEVPSIVLKDVSNTDDWVDENFSYRKILLINKSKVEGELSNFPILINLENDLDLKDHAKSDGSDIMFTNKSGDILYREIEDYNSQTGSLVAWVRVNELKESKDKLIYMYYGNESANFSNDTQVWDENYLMVQHLDENINNSVKGLLDSTINNNDATPTGFTYTESSNLGIESKINKGVIFNAENELINTDDIIFDQNENWTVSLWHKLPPLPQYTWSGLFGSNIGSTGGYFLYHGADSEISWYQAYDSSTTTAYGWFRSDLGLDREIPVNKWIYLTITNEYLNSNQSQASIYINNKEYFDTETIDWYFDTNKFTFSYIGTSGSISRNFKGNMDEVRVSNKVRSENWIKTEYNNQNEPSSFYYTSFEQIK